MKKTNKKPFTKKSPVKKTVIKKPILKTKQAIVKNIDSTITESLKKKVFPYLINDIIASCHRAKIGQSIRIGKLGRIKKSKRQGTVNGHNYNTITYAFKAFSALKNK